MEIPVAALKALLADKGYDGDRFRESLLILGILPIIPPRSSRNVPEHPDCRRYRDRNRVERMFGKFKQQRRIAARYDKTVLSFESSHCADARLWLKSFVNTAYDCRVVLSVRSFSSSATCFHIPQRLGSPFTASRRLDHD